jgi:hypothetical protein
MSLVVAENITKDYRVGEVVVPALRGVSFAIDPASYSRPKSRTASFMVPPWGQWINEIRIAGYSKRTSAK